MTTLTDVDHEAVVHIGAYIAVLGGHGREREQAVELRQHIRIYLHLRHPFAQRQHQFLIEPILDDLYPLLGGRYLLFVGLELLRDIALRVHQRLLADPLRRHLLFVGVAHLEIIPEYIVIAYLQALNTRSLYLALRFMDR